MNANPSVARLRAFVQGLEEGERRELISHMTRFATARLSEILPQVASQLSREVLDGNTPGLKEVLQTAREAWMEGSRETIHELLGLEAQDPTDIIPEVELLLRRMDEQDSPPP